ncbi:MAG: rRNA maturation RNase YbeY [Oscillospiraceae bacterium]|nr:rRNA maturation RNase YbeY [Oscillospiraceae bacterium]
MNVKKYDNVKHKVFMHSGKEAICGTCKQLIIQAVQAVLQYERVDVPCVVSVLITDDEVIRDYNYEYRGLDEPTDVLSFPMQTFRKAGWGGIYDPEFDESTGELTLGDIVISLETIKRYAAEYGNTIEHETAYMIIHSTLHLLGYDHDDESSDRIMHNRSKKVILYLLRSGEEYYI